VTDDASVDVGVAVLSLTKTAGQATVTMPGETIAFQLTVHNPGSVAINQVVITDTALPGVVTPADCAGIGTLQPGQTGSCTVTYQVRQADLDTGMIVNTATVTGRPVGSDEPLTGQATTTVTAIQSPQLSLLVTMRDPDQPRTAGEVIHYVYTISNPGNVTVTDPTVTPARFTGTNPWPEPNLDTCTGDVNRLQSGQLALPPGGTIACTAQPYTVTTADVQAGTIINTSIAHAVTSSGTPVTIDSPPDSVTATITATTIPVVTPAPLAQTPTAPAQASYIPSGGTTLIWRGAALASILTGLSLLTLAGIRTRKRETHNLP
jgi:uncharacterized repeat protein (TIGR01451 family)